MRNVTLSAEDSLIDQARDVARSQNKTLNQAFREWLTDFTANSGSLRAREFLAAMEQIHRSGVRTGRTFTRDEMNER